VSADLGWVETPTSLANLLADAAQCAPLCRVLDPSAGRGALVRAALARGSLVTAVELDAGRAAHLRATTDPATVRVFEEDFLALHPDDLPSHHIVLMSPPFRTHDRAHADLAHVAHATRFLAPYGRLVAIMHARLLDPVAALDVMHFHAALAFLGARVQRLPVDAFHEAGGTAPCVLVTLDWTLAEPFESLWRPDEH
jgi:predicted RNA methylase